MKKKSIILGASLILLGACSANEGNGNKGDKNKDEANVTSVIDKNSDKVIVNGHEFEYDTLSGATVLSSRKDAVEMDSKEKEEKMFWTVQPPQGLIEGDYYYGEKEFNEGFTATADLVLSGNNIVHLELDEIAPDDYYSEDWAGEGKRRSGYADFQASKDRTSRTLVTWVNGATFLEWQALKKNGLDINYETIFGASNSSRDALIPLLKDMSKEVEQPSKKYYIGYTEEAKDGVSSRMELIFEDKKIIKVKYDEIFADNKDEIKDKELQKYFRQSKYDSVTYNKDTEEEFRKFSNDVSEQIIKNQEIKLDTSKFDKEYQERLTTLLKSIGPAVNDYMDSGRKSKSSEHKLFKEEAKQTDYFKDKIKMTRKDSQYDKKTENYYIKLEVENTSEKDYSFSTNKFYLYVHNKDNAYDTLTDEDIREIVLKPGEKQLLDLNINPVYTTDTDVDLVYDGNEDVYLRVEVPEVSE